MYPNILVIRLSSLGDIALTGPVYKSLKAHWPDCRISVLVKPAFAPLLEGHPCVDEVIPFHGLFDALRRVRAGRFSHLLDLHGNLRSRLLSAFAGVPERARYRKAALARRLFVALGWTSPALAMHTIDRYLGALSAWGIVPRERGLALGDVRAQPLGEGPALRRVLIVQTAFLGDATLTVPLARALKRLHPECRVTVLTRPDCADIFRSSGWTDDVLTDDKRGGLPAVWRLARRLRAERFDLALIPHRSFRSALAARLAGIPERIGFDASAGSLLFTRTIPFAWGMHDLERNLSLLLPLQPGLTPSAETVYLRPRGGDAGLDARLEREGVPPGAALVGLHPGSIWPTKRWPWERFAALGRRLALEQGARIVLVGGHGDAELTASVARAAGVPVLDWAGKTSLAELIDLMGRLSLFVTNDSGPMHVATGSGVPTLALFGPTTRELGFFPYGASHRVLQKDLPCRPCGLHGAKECPRGHFLCMRLISIEEAYAAATDILRARPAPAPAAPR